MERNKFIRYGKSLGLCETHGFTLRQNRKQISGMTLFILIQQVNP